MSNLANEVEFDTGLVEADDGLDLDLGVKMISESVSRIPYSSATRIPYSSVARIPYSSMRLHARDAKISASI